MIAKLTSLLGRVEWTPKKILLAVMVIILVVYVDFSYVLKLQLKAVKELSPKQKLIATQLNQLQKELAGIDELKNRAAARKEGIPAAKRIIREEEMPTLLENIATFANRHNIKIIKIVPVKEVAKDKKEKDLDKPAAYLINLDLIGSYHPFGKFINDLENFSQFLFVESLKMARDPGDYLHEKITLVLKTYVKQ